MELDRITDRVMSGTKQRIQEKENSLMRSIARIDALSPLKVMARGFSVVTKQDKCVTKVGHLDVGDAINVSLSDGSIDCTVTNINKKAEV